MNTHMNLSGGMPPVRAQKKHIALFVIACILLVGTVFCNLAFREIMEPIDTSESVESPLPGGEIVAGLAIMAAYTVAKMILLVGFFICWGGGQVISALLAMNKEDKPRWLWVSSLVLAWVNVACVAAMIGIGLLM